MKNRKLWLLVGGIVLVLVLAVTPLMAGCAAPPEEVKPPVEEKPPVEKPPVEKPPVEKPPVEKPPEEVWELTFSDFTFEGATNMITNWWWMDEIERRTNGRVHFTRYHSGSLFGGFEILGAMGAGGCDAGSLAAIYTPAELDLNAGLGGIPMLTDYNLVYMLAATEMIRTEPGLIEEARRNNVIFLNGGPATAFEPVTTKPITSAEDLKGMKLLCPTPASMYAVQLMGAIPTAMEQAELYEGLARGLLDGLVISISDTYTLKLFELCKYLTYIGLGPTGGFPLAMNLDTWNSFPPDIQKIILDTADEHLRHFDGVFKEQDEEFVKAMREEGVTFSALSAEEIQGFRDLGVIDYCIDQWVKVKPEQEQERRAFIARFLETVKAIKVEPWMYAPCVHYK